MLICFERQSLKLKTKYFLFVNFQYVEYFNKKTFSTHLKFILLNFNLSDYCNL